MRTAVWIMVMTIALVGTASAQLVNVTSVAPEVAAPGDVITLRGTGFLNSTHIRFTANVGGFTGQLPAIVALSATSDTEVKVIVPTINAFVFPPAVPPGNPVGFFEVRDVGGLFSAPLPFYFLEGDHDGVTTIGLGTTNSSGCRGSAGFTIAGGPPVSGNPAFVFTGENVTPFSPCYTVIGFPPFGPIPIFDGFLAFEPLLPYGVPASVASDASGRAILPAPIGPVMVGATFTLSWVYIDSITFATHITNGLQFAL